MLDLPQAITACLFDLDGVRDVLIAAGIGHLFEARVDGAAAEPEGLREHGADVVVHDLDELLERGA